MPACKRDSQITRTAGEMTSRVKLAAMKDSKLRRGDRIESLLVPLLLVACAEVASAQVPKTVLPPDPVLGAWKLNLARSKYATPPPKSMTVTIAAAERGYVFTVDAIGPDGQPQRWGFTSA